MSTLAQGDSIIDISDEILDTIEVAPITIEGVNSNPTDAVEIRLTNEDGTSLRKETTGSTVLTGEALQGSEEDPSSINIVSDGTKEAHTVIINTAVTSNAVITHGDPVGDAAVAPAQIVVSSPVVESVSVKTSSTEQKSQVRFDQTTDSLTGVQVEMEGAGGNLDVQSSLVESLAVSASGTQFSEITFGSEVDAVNNAQIELSQAGGSIELQAGELTSSAFAISSNPETVNTVTLGSNHELVADTTFDLLQGSTEIGIASDTVQNISINHASKQPSTLNINSGNVQGFALSIARSQSTVNLASESSLKDTALASTAKKSGVLTANITAVSRRTTISNAKRGLIDASFADKAVDPVISSEGKGTIQTSFSKLVRRANFTLTKGSLDSTFSGKLKGITVDASSSKQNQSLEFQKSAQDSELNLGKGADSIIYGGAIKGDTSLDLGKDGKTDTVVIEKPGKVEDLTISNIGGKDIFQIGDEEFLGKDLSSDSFNNINLEFK